MRRMGRKSVDTSVVAAVAQQTAEAADLARIDGQERLASPYTNPAVREYGDELRDDEHRLILKAASGRTHRTIRVADRRAANAERTLEVLQAAREMSSPARSVLALHKGRTRFMGAALGASLTLSAGSAIGVAALAQKHGAPAEIGYIAEVGLTGLTTTVILYRSHLAQHGGALEGWKDKVLWALMVAPLVASIVANAYGTGGVGVACSVGAAAFSLLSYVIADASAEALQAKAKLVSGTDELELRTIATGDEPNHSELFRTVPGSPVEPEPKALDDAVRNRIVPNMVPICSGPVGIVHLSETRTHRSEPADYLVPNQVVEPTPEPEPVSSELVQTVVPNRPEPTAELRTVKRTGTPNLGDRAIKKAAEVQQVQDLIAEFGFDNVGLPQVRKMFGTAVSKTTAYSRLVEARANLNLNQNRSSEPDDETQTGS